MDNFYYSNISQREALRSLLFSLFDSQKPIEPITHFAPFLGQGEYWSKIKTYYSLVRVRRAGDLMIKQVV